MIKTGRQDTKVFLESGDKGFLTKELTQDLQTKTISQALGTSAKATSKAQDQVVKEVSNIISKAKIKTTSTPFVSRPRPSKPQAQQDIKLIQKDLFIDTTQTNRFVDQTTKKFGDLGVITGRLGTGQRGGQRQQQQPKVKTKQRPRQQQKPFVDVAAATLQRQSQRLRTRLQQKPKQKQKQRQSFATISIVPTFPRISIAPIPFGSGSRKRKRKRKQRFAGAEDFAFIEGFSARALNLPSRIIKLSDIRKGKRETLLGLRGKPIIINDFDIPSSFSRRRKRKKR